MTGSDGETKYGGELNIADRSATSENHYPEWQVFLYRKLKHGKIEKNNFRAKAAIKQKKSPHQRAFSNITRKSIPLNKSIDLYGINFHFLTSF